MCFMSLYYFFNALPVHQGDSHIPGEDEVFNWQSSQFVNLFCFKDTFSGVIQSKQSRKMFLARKTTVLTSEGIFQRYINSENCELSFSCGRKGRVPKTLDFTAQIWGCLGTALASGMPESRQNVLSTINFLSFLPLPLTQPSEQQEAKSRGHKVNQMRFIIWLCCQIGRHRWLYLRLLQSSQLRQVI